METHHFSSQIHDLESCPLREENRQLKLELEAIKDLAQKTEGERQQHCADLMAADERIEELEARIKELELALSNSRKYGRQLRKRFNDYRQRINELEAAISKMETTESKWISVKDRPPKEGEIIYGAGKFIKGLFVLKNEEWYTKEEYDDFAFEETHGYNIDAIDFWTEPPKPPTTEDSSVVEKEK